jgi:hypothetical protein
MRTKLRPGVVRSHQSQSEHGTFASFEMKPEFEAVGKQRLHHQAHLVLGGITCGARLDVESIHRERFRQLRPDLAGHKFMREGNVIHQRKSGRETTAWCLRIAGV